MAEGPTEHGSKENYVRFNRPNEFKIFDQMVIKYLSQNLEIPQEWKDYGQALRDMTKDCDDSKVEEVNNVWLIHWPTKPE
jgi:hypothetical protein